jgi:hypothetical protein
MTGERLDRVLDPAFIQDIDQLPTEELRRRRADAEAEEEAISYVRRLLQGRLDMLRAELRRRSEEGNGTATDLLSMVTAVLVEDRGGERDPSRTRALRLRVPPGVEPHEARLDAIVAGNTLDGVEGFSDQMLEDLVGRLADHERWLSGTRRELFQRIDTLRSELAARYKDGRAAISDLLTEPR